MIIHAKTVSIQLIAFVHEADVLVDILAGASNGEPCPPIPQLKAQNIRSGFFEHENFLALLGVLPDYGHVAASLAYDSVMRMGKI